MKLFLFTLSLIFIVSCNYNFETKPLVSDADGLENTDIVSHLKNPIPETKNIIWCSTFQLAWNELSDVIGEDIKLQDSPEMVNVLNEKLSTKEDIDEASYVACAGMGKDGILDKIRKEVDEKFGETTSLLPQKIEPNDIVAYSFLLKKLNFKHHFYINDSPLNFKGKKIRSFGIDEIDSEEQVNVSEQVVIHDYVSQDNFLIELKTKQKEEQLILARMTPSNLLDMITKVNKKMDNSQDLKMRDGDALWIPDVNYDITKSYNKLLNKQFLNKKWQDYIITKAKQNIRFQLDNKGVTLKSEAVIATKSMAIEKPEPKIMFFDGPFLLLLKRRDKKMPYFAMWVGNPELLIEYKK